MSKVYFLSDLHLGHEGSLKWAGEYREGNTVDEMNRWIIDTINAVVTKRDTLWFLGDICMRMEDMPLFNEIPCRKKLILGNHDTFDLPVYLKYFDWVGAYTKYKGFWLSHMPIHQFDFEYRVRGNIHGHLHHKWISSDSPEWWRYYNVSIEQSLALPVPFESILRRHVELEQAHQGGYQGQ